MGTLTPGVLLKLLEEMGIEGKAVIDGKNPVLLQIRSIIPVLAEGDLWPSQGFYLKISDSTHAMFVSLAPEEDEMVLCNKLQLGQLIYVEKLEAAYPVPMLKGVKPIPGRQPCIGNPQDLLGVDILEKSSNLMTRGRNEVKNSSKGRFRSLSPNKGRERREIGVVQSRTRPSSPDCKGSRSSKPSSGHTDSESIVSSCSSVSNPRRRSWCGLAKTRSADNSDCAVIKHEIKPVPQRRCHSNCGSPDRAATAGYDGSAEKSSTRTRTKDIGLVTQSVKTSTKSKEPLTQQKCVETVILWDSLPSSLVNLGKEVSRQKDYALLAAVEALQEAAAAERLLKCLSSFSELQSMKEDDQQSSIDKFLKFQEYMSESKEIIQSLTTISPVRTPEADSNSNGSIREAVKLALERKRNATTWIKAALTSDLTIVSSVEITKDPPIEASVATRSTSKQIGRNQKPKGSVIVKKQRNIEHFGALGAEKENQHEWIKGSALSSVLSLAHSIQDESKTWFLSYMENYLDGFVGESSFKISDSQFSEIMCQMKRLNDWLDVMEKRERSCCNGAESSSDLEACGRIKEKIYGILLKHVERTAMVWENMHALA